MIHISSPAGKPASPLMSEVSYYAYEASIVFSRFEVHLVPETLLPDIVGFIDHRYVPESVIVGL